MYLICTTPYWILMTKTFISLFAWPSLPTEPLQYCFRPFLSHHLKVTSFSQRNIFWFWCKYNLLCTWLVASCTILMLFQNFWELKLRMTQCLNVKKPLLYYGSEPSLLATKHIHRCYMYFPKWAQIVFLQLHGFCDASELMCCNTSGWLTLFNKYTLLASTPRLKELPSSL